MKKVIGNLEGCSHSVRLLVCLGDRSSGDVFQLLYPSTLSFKTRVMNVMLVGAAWQVITSAHNFFPLCLKSLLFFVLLPYEVVSIDYVILSSFR